MLYSFYLSVSIYLILIDCIFWITGVIELLLYELTECVVLWNDEINGTLKKIDQYIFYTSKRFVRPPTPSHPLEYPYMYTRACIHVSFN